MSETATEPVEDQAGPDSTADEPKVFDAEYVRKLRDEAAKYRTAAKQNADAAKRLAEFENSQKSELQRLTEERDALKALAEAKEAEAEGLRIAGKYGIDPAVLLEPDLETRAKNLAALLTPKEETQPAPKGAVGPYVPGEGKAPRKGMGSTADMFAASIESAFS